MKKYFLILFIFMVCALNMTAQENNWGIKFSGFVNTEIFTDTRMTENAREGIFLLYPKNVLIDTLGNDLNAEPSFNILSIKTRLMGKIKMPDVLGAKTSGLIEAEFFGSVNDNINTFRLRHAYVSLDWDMTTLLIGQYWHPMFVTEVFPGTVSFNTGTPFQPFNRSPQVRLVQKFSDNFRMIAAATSQRDFRSPGPLGASNAYLSNTLIPDLNLHLQTKFEENVIGVGGNYKVLQPRTYTEHPVKKSKYATDETVADISAMGYIKLAFDPVTIKLEGIYGNNLPEMQLLGGYMVKSYDTLTGHETYTTIGAISGWGEISVSLFEKAVELGVFAGYSKTSGSKDDIEVPTTTYKPAIYTAVAADKIDYLMRLSPRLVYTEGSIRCGLEGEYTVAAYGKGVIDGKYKIEDSKEVNNLRIILSLNYNF